MLDFSCPPFLPRREHSADTSNRLSGKCAINITWYPSNISDKVNPLRAGILHIWNCSFSAYVSSRCLDMKLKVWHELQTLILDLGREDQKSVFICCPFGQSDSFHFYGHINLSVAAISSENLATCFSTFCDSCGGAQHESAMSWGNIQPLAEKSRLFLFYFILNNI